MVGRIGGAFGVAGLVRIKPFTAAIDGLLDFRELLLAGPEGGWHPVEVRQGRVHGDHLIVELAGVANREEAAALRGREIAVWRDSLPEEAPDEVYLTDLVGLEVVGRDGRVWGLIDGFIEVGGTQVMRVPQATGGSPVPAAGNDHEDAGRQNAPGAGRSAGRQEQLIPFIEPYVVEVDLQQGRVVIDWPGIG